MPSAIPLIEDIRATSRALVRELGFMGGRFAGTDLSPSAVHALIEIERGGLAARDLGARLRLEKSSVSRMVRKLIAAGDVMEAPDKQDARAKRLSLTPSGQQRVSAIHAYARQQVSDALARLQPGQDRAVLEGMRLYAHALTPRQENAAHPPAIQIVQGYVPGLIARVTGMHVDYYARHTGFGLHFESVVASGLADFCKRLSHPGNAIWTARQGDEIVGAIAIDGEDQGGHGAHLRWFIMDDAARGTGAGKRLLDTALAFADASGCRDTHLWTFSGLDAARHLYETRGFVLTEARPGSQWGKEVLEQRFVRQRPPSGIAAMPSGGASPHDKGHPAC
ncbi:Transcriptional regulator, MarR family / Acetyltransferase (GNAT) [plant metagenome]